jgi:hypothetical protein
MPLLEMVKWVRKAMVNGVAATAVVTVRASMAAELKAAGTVEPVLIPAGLLQETEAGDEGVAEAVQAPVGGWSCGPRRVRASSPYKPGLG